MVKNKKLLAYTIVLLYTLSISAHAQAGFYDWLVSKDESTKTLVSSRIEAQDVSSFDNVFAWDDRKPEDSIIKKIQPKEEIKTQHKVVRESIRQVTAYNVGDINQTDSTPCIGAYPKVNLCDELERGTRVCAANFVALGTVLRISIGGESFECVVWDRMNSRFPSRVDVAMSSSEKIKARQFGLQKGNVQILEEIEKEEISI